MTVVDTDELMELKKQAEEINKRIAELTAPKNIAYRCKVKPYGLPYFLDNDARNPVVFTDRHYDTDAWAHFLALGKMIHAENGVFKTRGMSWRVFPFIPVSICMDRWRCDYVSALASNVYPINYASPVPYLSIGFEIYVITATPSYCNP